MPFVRGGDLEVAQDLAFQRRSWVVERVGWAAMALVVVAALAGLFGRGGPLSEAQARSSDGLLAIEYERFPHYESPTQLRLRFGPEAVREGKVRVWLSRAYLDKARIEQVQPQPERAELGAERVLYVFAAREAGEITFELRPDHAGPMEGRAGVEGGGEVSFRHFVYP